MPIPTYDQFIEPLLRFLARYPDGARTADIYQALADEMKLSESEREELLPSGVQAVYKNRIGWAQDRLKRAGLSASPKRGLWTLTKEGISFAKQNKNPLTTEQLTKITVVRPGSTIREQTFEVPIETQTLESPDERLNNALFEINESVGVCPPKLASQQWRMIGHELEHPPKPAAKADSRHTQSTSRADLQRVGGTGDAGIDGVISLDRLGLEFDHPPKPSAKADKRLRYSNAVGRPDVQAFYGALAGQRASKGVFITTSAFTQQAMEFVQSVERIVLIDGERLTALMIEHGVGVSHRVVKVPKVDGDYFVE